jgi:hypothetical protein
MSDGLDDSIAPIAFVTGNVNKFGIGVIKGMPIPYHGIARSEEVVGAWTVPEGQESLNTTSDELYN